MPVFAQLFRGLDLRRKARLADSPKAIKTRDVIAGTHTDKNVTRREIRGCEDSYAVTATERSPRAAPVLGRSLGLLRRDLACRLQPLLGRAAARGGLLPGADVVEHDPALGLAVGLRHLFMDAGHVAGDVLVAARDPDLLELVRDRWLLDRLARLGLLVFAGLAGLAGRALALDLGLAGRRRGLAGRDLDRGLARVFDRLVLAGREQRNHENEE